VLKKEEGGRHTPFVVNYKPQFFIRTADITGTITALKEGAEMVMPGDNTTVTIELRVERARARARAPSASASASPVLTSASFAPLLSFPLPTSCPLRIMPVAMHTGLRFALREGGKTVGAGVVATVIE